MPFYNITVDDTSPLWRYTGLWSDSDSADSSIVSYANKTFHATNQTGATADFMFTGTAIYVFGAKRSNHGTYRATLDGSSTTGDGAGDNEFQTPLYAIAGLDNTKHQLTMTDTGTDAPNNSWFDVDFATITVGNSDETATISDVTLDDTAANITYKGASWDSSPNNLSNDYYMSTMHRTNSQGDQAIIKFTGNAIGVYGAVSGNHGPFSVSLDGAQAESYTGFGHYRAQTLLYYTSGLKDGSHTLTITNTASARSIFFDLDYVQVTTYVPQPSAHTPSSSPASSTQPATTSPSSTASNVGPIVGGVVGGLALLALGALGIFILMRRRRRQGHRGAPPHDPQTQEYMQGAPYPASMASHVIPSGLSSGPSHLGDAMFSPSAAAYGGALPPQYDQITSPDSSSSAHTQAFVVNPQIREKSGLPPSTSSTLAYRR